MIVENKEQSGNKNQTHKSENQIVFLLLAGSWFKSQQIACSGKKQTNKTNKKPYVPTFVPFYEFLQDFLKAELKIN